MTANAQTQWTLTEYESATTLETWRVNLMSILSLEEAFEPYLRRDVIWGRKTKTNPFRGFSGADAEQQVSALETMLGLIANYAPIVSRGTIVKNSTSLNAIHVWKVLHLYYGIQSNDDTGQPCHSETPHQSYNPPDQEYAMCKPAEKPDCDFQCLPRDDKPLLKRSKSNRQPDCDLQYQSKDHKAFQLIIEPKMQSRTIDILLSHADDESEPRDDTTPVLIEGSENITPDLLDIISTEQSSSQCIGSLKTVHNSSAKATRSLQLPAESTKIFPDLTDVCPATASYNSFTEPPIIQVPGDQSVTTANYFLLPSSAGVSYSCELDQCRNPIPLSLQPDQLQFPGDCDPTQCPQQRFLLSAVPFSSSDLRVDHMSSISMDTTRNDDAFLCILDEFSYVDSSSQHLQHQVPSSPENKVKQETQPTPSDAKKQATEHLVDVSFRPFENESVEPIIIGMGLHQVHLLQHFPEDYHHARYSQPVPSAVLPLSAFSQNVSHINGSSVAITYKPDAAWDSGIFASARPEFPDTTDIHSQTIGLDVPSNHYNVKHGSQLTAHDVSTDHITDELLNPIEKEPFETFSTLS